MDGLLLGWRHGQYLGGWARRGNGRGRERKEAVVVCRRIYLAGVLLLSLLLGTGPAAAIKLLPAIEQLYSSVEMAPPSATQMTVCYGFVCRLRLTLVFAAAERTAITNMMSKGRASAAEERKAIQQVFVWFDHRVGREVGTNKRIASAD